MSTSLLRSACRSLEDYRSGRSLMDHLGADRLIDPPLTGMLLAIRRGLIEEINAASMADYALIDRVGQGQERPEEVNLLETFPQVFAGASSSGSGRRLTGVPSAPRAPPQPPASSPVR